MTARNRRCRMWSGRRLRSKIVQRGLFLRIYEAPGSAAGKTGDTGSVCNVFDIKKESEPVPDGEEVRIFHLSNPVCGMPHRFPMPGSILPCSCIDQLLSYNLLGSGADIVHALYPCHWIVGFQSFCDSFGGFHLVNHPFQPVLRLPIQISKITECS